MEGCYQLNKRERLRFKDGDYRDYIFLEYKVFYRTWILKRQKYKWCVAIRGESDVVYPHFEGKPYDKLTEKVLLKLHEILKSNRKRIILKNKEYKRTEEFNAGVLSQCDK